MYKKFQKLLYVINMSLLIVVVSMNMLNVQVPKLFSYFLLITASTYLILVFRGWFKRKI